ncbi:zinc finger protein ZAT5 [Primulina eburnea]|uniref:zinc finger protein ZAT5 n=1 Tax=Primulina eburnea TaxID=1245227 RepID=UPI003C6C53D5
MESEEDKDLFPIVRGKRTKRYMIHSPIAFTTEPPGRDHDAATVSDRRHHPISPASISSEESTTTGVEDTARCLIFLAHGHFSGNPGQNNNSATASTAQGGAGGDHQVKGACLYTCKTCNRAFRSFQALGGHRASHKKPKNDRKVSLSLREDDFRSPSLSSSKKRMSPDYLSLQLNNFPTTVDFATPKPAPSPRIHTCLHCGAEFTSGQALGGHMRRHRSGLVSPSPNPNAACIYIEEHNQVIEGENEEISNKPGNGLALDLNLPAPEMVLTLKD